MGDNIVLVDGALVSDILIETCEKHGILFYVANEEMKTKFAGSKNLISKEQISKISKTAERIYTTSENVLPMILGNREKNSYSSMELFKNKFLFRTKLSSFPEYRDFFFKELNTSELLDFEPSKKVVLKPSRGFFSLGVRVCSPDNFKKNAKEAITEAEDAAKTYPSATIMTDKWLVEEYIAGNEFAVDAYFDKQEEPVINAVYYHPFKDENDTRDLLYYSNKRIMEEQVPKVKLFLTRLRDSNSSAKLVNFPIHMEYRVKNGIIYPIEINPWRFGGFGLSDLPSVWGLNQYEKFFGMNEGNEVKMKDGVNYAFILCRNPNSMRNNTKYWVDHVGYRKMLNDLEISVRQYHEFDYNKFGVASVANCEARNEKKMLSLLECDTSPYYLEH